MPSLSRGAAADEVAERLLVAEDEALVGPVAARSSAIHLKPVNVSA